MTVSTKAKSCDDLAIKCSGSCGLLAIARLPHASNNNAMFLFGEVNCDVYRRRIIGITTKRRSVVKVPLSNQGQVKFTCEFTHKVAYIASA